MQLYCGFINKKVPQINHCLMFVPAAQLGANFESVYYFCLLADILLKLVLATFCICDSKEPVINSTNQTYSNATIKPAFSSRSDAALPQTQLSASSLREIKPCRNDQCNIESSNSLTESTQMKSNFLIIVKI